MRVTTSPSSPSFNHGQNPIFCSAIITSSPSSSRSSSPLSFCECLSSTGPSCLSGPASSILKVTNAKLFPDTYSKSDEERMDKLIDNNVVRGYSFDTFDECDEKRITGIITAAERRLELRKIEKAYRERENRQEIKKDIEQPRLFRLGLNLDNDRPIPDCEIPAWYRVRPATRAQRDPLTLLPGPLQLWPHHMYDTVLHRHLLKQRTRKPEHRTLGILEMIGEKDKHGFGRCKDFRLQTPAMCDHEKYDVPTFPPVPPAEHVTVPSYSSKPTAGLVDDPDGYVSTYNTKGCPFGVIGDRRTSVLYGVIGDGRPNANANPANTDVTPISTIAHPTPSRGPVYTAAELHEDSKNGNTTPSPVSSQGLITPKMPACNFCSAVGDVPINVTQAKAGSNARTFDIESFTRRLARTRMLHAEAL
ncbi:hypothetical protein BDQ17DRAFT_1371036 [Cyathus striatus]|nr:hypothetical protein BDQ17DRAFT_1371036 [Cyathus striatus]